MDISSPVSAGGSSIFLMLIYVVYLGFFCVSVFCLILLIKLSLRGIKALDIYIEKNKVNK